MNLNTVKPVLSDTYWDQLAMWDDRGCEIKQVIIEHTFEIAISYINMNDFKRVNDKTLIGKFLAVS